MTSQYLATIKECFEFLTRDYGFLEPTAEETAWALTASYKSNHVCVDVEVDWRDEYVGVSLIRLIDGNRPKGYQDFFEKGNMLHLYEVIEWHNASKDAGIGVRVKKEKRSPKNRGSQTIGVRDAYNIISFFIFDPPRPVAQTSHKPSYLPTKVESIR